MSNTTNPNCPDFHCPPLPTQCSCAAGQTCQVIISTCSACGYLKCIDPPSVSHSSGVSKGALAGAIIGVLAALALVLAAVWYYRRREKARRAALERLAREPKDIPASAEAVLSRPDPVEKPATPNQGHVRVFSSHSDGTINLQSGSHRTATTGPSRQSTVSDSPIHNPFADDLSVGGSERSEPNMIPIAVLPYGTVQTPSTEASNPHSHQLRAQATSPMPSRPVRSPDLDINFDGKARPPPPSAFNLAHVNVSNDSMPGPSDQIAESVRSNMTGFSTGTYATDLFTESPTIVTRQQGRILGLSKAQVVEVPSSYSNAGSPLASSHLTPTMPMSRMSRSARSIRSPLAQQAFTPNDMIEMDEQPELSPFADSNAKPSSIRMSTKDGLSMRSNATFESGAGWDVAGDTESIASGIEASITSAKRVVLNPQARAISQSSGGGLSGTSSGNPYRYSVGSEASSRADSILEAFPFVPPSLPPTPRSQHTFKGAEIIPPSPTNVGEHDDADSTRTGIDSFELRRKQGISTYTQGSTSGLESFPFQLHSNSDSNQELMPTHLSKQADRASLDTLALTRDLSNFPLAYDDDSHRVGRVKYVDPSRNSSTTHR